MLRQMANYYTIVFQWAHAVQLLLVAAAIVCVLTPLKAERRALLIGLAEFVGVFAACMLSEMFFFGLSAYSRALGGMCFPLALFVVIVLYAAVFCRFYARLRIIITSLLYACIVTVTVYVAQLTQIVEFPNLAALELTSIAVNLLVVFIAFVFTRFSIARFINIPDSAAVLAFFNSFFVVASVFVNYVLMSEVYGEFGLRQIGIVYTFVEGVVMFVMMLVAYCLIYIICKRNDLILELQAEEKMAESDRKLLDITQKNLADLRLLRHDIKNRYAYMAMLLENRQYEELKKYLQTMYDEVAPSLSLIDCGNKTISMILNMEKAKAEARGMRMETELNVPPVLPFRDTSLCSVFSNLIDNAIEACSLCGQDQPCICVRVSILQEYLYIGVINPLPEGRSERDALKLTTTKTNAANHGFGTKIVRKIAAHYNGYVTYSAENGMFIAEVMIDMMCTTENGAAPPQTGGDRDVPVRDL